MFPRERARTCLVAAAVLAIFLALMPDAQYLGGLTATRAEMEYLQANPQDMPTQTNIRLGWQSSPLFTYRRESRLLEANGAITVSRSERATIGWVTWSSATLAVGLGLLWVARRLKGEMKARREAD